MNRSSKAMSTKQTLMADHHHSSQSSHSQNYKRPLAPSFFGSPRFKAFTKAIGEIHEAAVAAAAISPTSILDSSKQSSPFCNNPFWDHDTILNPPKSPRLFPENKHQGVGLALIDLLTDDRHKTINEDDNSSSSKPNNNSNNNNNNKVLFATKLRVKIPPLLPAAPSIHLAPSGSANSGTQITKDPPKVIYSTECLPPTEMELSEEYTRVIAHGPNPKTTHIFDNCIIDSYCSLSNSGVHKSNSAPENFLSFCYTCKKNLEQKIDIYIYRGEKAFCSQECRYQEMLLDDEVDN